MEKDSLPEINDILATADLLSKALKLAGLITRIFREAGWDLVVVGGSAVEFYTEGAYMSGDIDMCRRNLTPIPLRTAQNLIGQLGGTGGPRSWKVAGLFVDLLGLLENEALTPCRTIETPCGKISIAPAELILAERKNKLKTAWTWEEWQASRQARRDAAKRIGPPITRRGASSSDRRLRAAFAGQRGPAFHGANHPLS